MDDEDRGDSPSQATVQIAAEASLIGSVMHNRGLMADLGDVSPNHFVDAVHRAAWARMMDDPTIGDELALQIAVPDMSDAQASRIGKSKHARATVLRARMHLFESRSRGELRRIYMEGLTLLDAKEATATDLAGRTSRALLDMSASATLSTPAADAARTLQRQERSRPISTGIRCLDYVSYGGLHMSQVTGLFARYKVGKTVMMATIARNLENQQIPTLMISLERHKHDIERFIVSRALGIDARDLDLIDNPEHQSAFEEYLEDRRFLRYIHKPGVTIDELRAMILAEVHAHGIRVVLVDYWQLIRNPASKSSQQEKQQDAAQMLADLAATLDVAIVVTGQLNQDGDPRGGEGILASAGMVIRINRPDQAEEGFLETMVSNKGPALSKGTPQHPSIALVLPGPHFEDYAQAA